MSSLKICSLRIALVVAASFARGAEPPATLLANDAVARGKYIVSTSPDATTATRR